MPSTENQRPATGIDLSCQRGEGGSMVVTLYILWLVLNVVGLILMVQGLLKFNKWLGFVE